ncbi:MAG TPA: DNA polymerase/3'-5' exonuclease PolX [Pyrinomonadaceae bacterium]|nr:DNA polymerase/3'-5' exonuclease PolX [Pyrinomonadaceae bacterium]
MKPVTDKFAIAAALQEIGALLELKGGEYFKARAYKQGARAVAELTEDLGKLVKENRLTFVKGIGYALAKQIQDLYTTGQSTLLNQLRAELPPGIIELSNIPGLSVKKVERLHQELGISTVEELKAACESHQLRDVKGFGAKTEQNILAAIALAGTGSQDREQRIHIHHALRAGAQIVEYLATTPGFDQGELAGSVRRWQETAARIVVVASAKKPQQLIDHFLGFPLVIRVEDQSAERCSAALSGGFKATLFAVKPNEFANVLLRATGSQAHLDKLDQIALKRKLKLTGKGIEKLAPQQSKSKTTVPVLLRTEAEIYQRLGMQYIPPELREDQGEVEAALAHALPEDLITAEDIRGMVHCHTKYSDGKHSVAEMVQAAESMGMKYITITDHSPTAFYANGLKIDRLQRQWEEIDLVQERTKVRILKGTESDITQDGSLDYPDWILEQFDVIIASIHSRYKMNEDQMTRRIVTAMQQPVFKIWGHALGRLIEKRPPFECRVEEILDVIAESHAAIEINGDPYRLDMEPCWVREARKRKIKFVISTDAHSTGALNNLKYGVGIARRGWVRRGEVLNALGVKAFQKAVRPM